MLFRRLSPLIICFLLACMPPSKEPQKLSPSPSPPVQSSQATSTSTPTPPPIKLQPQDSIILDITHPQVLQQLEKQYHFNFGSILNTLVLNDDSPRSVANNHLLDKQSPAYHQLSQQLKNDIEHQIKQIKAPLVTELHQALAFPAGNVGRRFDIRWLTSKKAFFQLIGIINRTDRKDFSKQGNCGEVRLIYRLAYRIKQQTQVGSRLPFTINVVLENPKETSCQSASYRWITSLNKESSQFIPWLISTPLNLKRLTLKQIEINTQIIRFPSGLEKSFAGQAIYLLKIYTFTQPLKIVIKPLENTPDVKKLIKNPALKKKFLNYIQHHLEEIDKGIFTIPEEFLATTALSYSTLGINRLANKPFDLLLKQENIPINQEKLEYIQSKNGLIERLNNRTCMGCHQSGSTAGFHFLGQDDQKLQGVTNRLQLSGSPHYFKELTRRKHYIQALLTQEKINQFLPHSLAPPLSLKVSQPNSNVKVNQSCLPDSFKKDFKSAHHWQCQSNLTCAIVSKNSLSAINFGQCIVKPTQITSLKAGMTCRAGQIKNYDKTGGSGELFNTFSYLDQFQSSQIYALPENKVFTTNSYNCRPTAIGVPLGRTFRNCTRAEANLVSVEPEVCAVVGGKQFDLCVEKDFHQCLEKIVVRGMVNSCSQTNPCREDYICQRLPYQVANIPTRPGEKLSKNGVGFCTPTYFLFQLRLDGHPIP